MRNYIRVILGFVIVFYLLTITGCGNTKKLQTYPLPSDSSRVIRFGDYVQFGRYMDDPILWKCIKKDNHEVILLSEDVLCFKAFDAAESGKLHTGNNYVEKFGSNHWENSNIREWLNSRDNKVKYTTVLPIDAAIWGNKGYADEPGFLSNFSSAELNCIKPVNHDGVTDIVSLLSLDEMFAYYKEHDCDYRFWKKNITQKLRQNSHLESDDISFWWWLRTPLEDNPGTVRMIDKLGLFTTNDPCTAFAYEGMGGVVPVLHLTSDTYKSGDGTKEKPYRINE